MTDNLEKFSLHKKQLSSLIAFGAVIFLFTFLVKLFQHRTFHTNAFDLSLYDTAIRNTVLGNFLFSAQLGRSFLSEHYSPILLLLVPFYQLYDSVLWLFVAQAICVSAVFFLSCRIALHYGIDFWQSFFLGVFCAFNKRFVEGVMFDFHPEIFAVPLILLLILFYLKEQLRSFYLAAFILLLVREDMALSLLGVAMLLAIVCKKQRTHYIVISVLAVIYFFCAVFMLIPASMPNSGEASRFIAERWGQFGSSPWEIGIGLLFSPGFLFKSILHAYCKLVETVGFLAVLSPIELLAALPYVGLHSTSSLELESSLRLHYSFGAISLMFWAMILTYRKGMRIFKVRRQLPFVICLIILVVNWRWKIYIPDAHTDKLHRIIDEIPENINISAQSPIVPHLIRRRNARIFPEQLGITFQESKYILLDEKIDTYPLTKDEFSKSLRKLKNSKIWKVIFSQDGIYLFRRDT